MNNFLKHMSFTKRETGVILFAVLVLTTGLSVKYYKQVISSDTTPYDYSKSDAEFKNRTAGAAADSFSLSDEMLTGKLLSAEGKLNSANISSQKTGEISYKSININTASKDELVSLPGIGESIAGRIITYREETKRFKKIEDLLNVNGIGRKKFEKIKEYIKAE